VNPLMVAQYLGARIYSAELTAAAWLDTRRFVRVFPLAWVHQGVRPWLPTGIAAAVLTLGHHSRTAAVIIVIASLVAVSFSRIAAKSHYVLNEEDRPCPYCPAGDDGDLPGGQHLARSGGPVDIPPAPAPMPDIDDRICEWADDLNLHLAAYIEEVSP